MNALLTFFILILAQYTFASNSCFENSQIKELIRASEALDKCFNGTAQCSDVSKKTIEEQKARNARRLVPFDRSKDEFMNRATGAVSVDFKKYNGDFSEKQVSGSGQKISRCHIITSAHLLYKDGKFPVASQNFTIRFHSGQTCNSKQAFESSVEGKVVFKMMDEGKDFECVSLDNSGNCNRRFIKGQSDLVIIKLEKNDNNFFSLNTTKPTQQRISKRVNCWGYPGHNANIPLTRDVSNMLLWAQKDAQIFTGEGFESEKGIVTNAIAYKGISGGGCVLPNNPKELVGVFANDNNSNGLSAISLDPEIIAEQGANYISGFSQLSKRFSESHGNRKQLADLDADCNSND